MIAKGARQRAANKRRMTAGVTLVSSMKGFTQTGLVDHLMHSPFDTSLDSLQGYWIFYPID